MVFPADIERKTFSLRAPCINHSKVFVRMKIKMGQGRKSVVETCCTGYYSCFEDKMSAQTSLREGGLFWLQVAMQVHHGREGRAVSVKQLVTLCSRSGNRAIWLLIQWSPLLRYMPHLSRLWEACTTNKTKPRKQPGWDLFITYIFSHELLQSNI